MNDYFLVDGSLFMFDLRQRFYFAHSPVRGEIVQLTQTLTDIFSRHDYPLTIKKLLGELLTASVLGNAEIRGVFASTRQRRVKNDDGGM